MLKAKKGFPGSWLLARILCAPSSMMMALDNTHEPGGGKDSSAKWPVRVLQHIVEQGRCTPPAKTPSLTLFGVITLHHANAAKRFGEAVRWTSALIFGRSRNIGRMVRKAFVDPVSEKRAGCQTRRRVMVHTRMNQVGPAR